MSTTKKAIIVPAALFLGALFSSGMSDAAHATEAHFSASLQVSAGSGLSRSIGVSITPMHGYKVNPDYPTKFSFEPSATFTPQSKVLRKADLEWKGKSAWLGTTLKLKSLGKHEIAGTLKFSLCNEEKCVTKKQRLQTQITDK